MNRLELTRRVKDHARREGARLVGVAGVGRFAEAPKGHRPADFLPDARAVIVLGLPVLRAYMRYAELFKDSEMTPEKVTRRSDDSWLGAYVEMTYETRLLMGDHIYRRCAYEFLNMELQRLSFCTALYLEELGYDAIYMPTTFGSSFSWNMAHPVPNQMAPFSHRHAAVAAGLGEFGLNNLLLTPQYGPLQRLVTVITTADLEPDPLYEGPRICLGEECGICKDRCPNDCFGDIVEYDCGGAQARVYRFDKERCGKYDDATRLRCLRQCITKCPAGLQRHPGPHDRSPAVRGADLDAGSPA